MSFKNFARCLAALMLSSLFMVNVNAITIEFNFAGECDDCAFSGDPDDVDFDPFDDGLTESVSGSLILDGLSVNNDGVIEFLGAGSATFTYNGSSLINAFSMNSPFLFTTDLLESGDVVDGSTFTFSSSQNVTDPNNPQSFNFPNFCTELGEELLDSCGGVGLVSFSLDSDGNWSIFGEEAFDIGGSGQFVVASVPEPGSAVLLALALASVGFTGRRKTEKR